MKRVIATLFWGHAPIFVLEDGTVMSPVETPTGDCSALSWEPSKDISADVKWGYVGGGCRVTIYKDGKEEMVFFTD